MRMVFIFLVCDVHKAHAAAVHCLAQRASHGVQNQSEWVELLKSYGFSFNFLFHKEVAYCLPHVDAFYPILVQHDGRAVDRNADFCQIREHIFF